MRRAARCAVILSLAKDLALPVPSPSSFAVLLPLVAVLLSCLLATRHSSLVTFHLSPFFRPLPRRTSRARKRLWSPPSLGWRRNSRRPRRRLPPLPPAAPAHPAPSARFAPLAPPPHFVPPPHAPAHPAPSAQSAAFASRPADAYLRPPSAPKFAPPPRPSASPAQPGAPTRPSPPPPPPVAPEPPPLRPAAPRPPTAPAAGAGQRPPMGVEAPRAAELWARGRRRPRRVFRRLRRLRPSMLRRRRQRPPRRRRLPIAQARFPRRRSSRRAKRTSTSRARRRRSTLRQASTGSPMRPPLWKAIQFGRSRRAASRRRASIPCRGSCSP